MAIAATNVTQRVSPNGEQPIMFGDSGMVQEVYELVDTGGTAAGAASLVLTPRYITDVRHVSSTLPVTDNLNLASVNTTVTLVNKIATLTTEKYRVTIIGRR
jgi:hypothetical protein